MTDELVSLRAILLSASQNDHDLFRQAASTARVPIEIVECKGVAAACRVLGAGADLVFIDGAIANVATMQVARPRARRAGRRSWCCSRRRTWPSSRSRPMRRRQSRCGSKRRGG